MFKARFLTGLIGTVFAVLGFSFTAFAACSSPEGAAGDVIYETNNNVVQYCNGTAWVNTGVKNGGADSSGCSDPNGDEGELVFNTSTGVMQFCNGADWVNMACADSATTGGGGCSTPEGSAGDLIYNTTASKLQFCDSTNWLNTGNMCLTGATPIIILASGRDASYYFYDGVTYGWGSQSGGRLWCHPDGGTGAKPTPGDLSSRCSAGSAEILSDWTMLDGGFYHVCGINSENRMFCWGNDSFGETGRGSFGASSGSAPTEVTGNHTDWSYVSTSRNNTTCGIRGGVAYCWGRNHEGQLGDNTTTDKHTPTIVANSITGWTQIDTGDNSSVCGLANGRAYCWGENFFGELGNGSTSSKYNPTQVSGNHTDWEDIGIGLDHACGLRNGRIYCWGGGGRIGNGSDWASVYNGSPQNYSATPVEISGGFSDWEELEVGSYHTCALRSGRMYCWGINSNGRLGDGTTTNRNTPVEVGGGYTDWIKTAPGYTTTCGMRSDYSVYCWGEGSDGQIGDGTTNDRLVPTAVTGLPTTVE